MLKKLIFTVYLFFPFVVYANQNINLQLSVDRQEIEVGEEFYIKINLDLENSESQIDLQRIVVPGLENYQQIGSSQSTQAIIINGKVTTSSSIEKTVIAHKTGDFQLGPVNFALKSSSGSTMNVKSNSLKVVVKDVSPQMIPSEKSIETNEIEATKDILNKKQKSIKFPFPSKGIKVFLAFFLIGGGIAISFYARRKKEDDKITSKKKLPDEKKGKIKLIVPKIGDADFYEKLRQFIVDYLHQMKSINAKAMTTKEMSEHLKNAPEIKEILIAYDNYKYAGEEGDRKHLLEIARKLITH